MRAQPCSSIHGPPPRPRSPPQALLEYKLVLMNKQEDVMVGLAHVPHRRYSPGIKITTVGECRRADGQVCRPVWVPP